MALVAVSCSRGARPAPVASESPDPTAPITQSPRPLRDVRLAPFTEAVRLDATHLRLAFDSGRSGCAQLDHVEVTPRGPELSVGVHVGNDLPDGVTGCAGVGIAAYAVAEVPTTPRVTTVLDVSRGVAVAIT
jgi:hypothetical protein